MPEFSSRFLSGGSGCGEWRSPSLYVRLDALPPRDRLGSAAEPSKTVGRRAGALASRKTRGSTPPCLELQSPHVVTWRRLGAVASPRPGQSRQVPRCSSQRAIAAPDVHLQKALGACMLHVVDCSAERTLRRRRRQARRRRLRYEGAIQFTHSRPAACPDGSRLGTAACIQAACRAVLSAFLRRRRLTTRYSVAEKHADVMNAVGCFSRGTWLSPNDGSCGLLGCGEVSRTNDWDGLRQCYWQRYQMVNPVGGQHRNARDAAVLQPLLARRRRRA